MLTTHTHTHRTFTLSQITYVCVLIQKKEDAIFYKDSLNKPIYFCILNLSRKRDTTLFSQE